MMFNREKLAKATRAGATGLAVALLATLSACGGNNDDNSTTAARFFNGIFLKDSGSGYYQFAAHDAGTDQDTTGYYQFYLDKDTDDSLQWTSGDAIGKFTPQEEDRRYITEEREFTPHVAEDSDIGASMKIVEKLSSGYKFGFDDKSLPPLFEITLTVQDVSGWPVSEVLSKDESARDTGLNKALEKSTAQMPANSEMYRPSQKTLIKHIFFRLSDKAEANSFKELQDAGTRVQELGGYQYVVISPEAGKTIPEDGTVDIYVQRKGGNEPTYHGILFPAGNIIKGKDLVTGYNHVAAKFLIEEQKKAAGLPQ